ncbi:tetratricopeptide repeat protein [Reinekea blandensis]|uniref:VWFA domain-containing protein n=1 Tax=Reinekea blandensis MED297 TaxID=314283 RepID=A4BEC3_9GAMM|nr:tetratricopeptide repeat protein [Reinekea blandensis]EAR09601.1 hypothetical protein MED297_12757 [Reinekea blandensis MED297]
MTLLRPEYLLLLLAWLPATLWWLKRRGDSDWQQLMDAELFDHLQRRTSGRPVRASRLVLPLFLLCLILALSGPAVYRTSSSTLNQGNLYVLLDNSLSMAIEDISPDRLTRAKRMIIDWSRSGLFGKTTVVTYSGSAHVLTPLTADSDTLELQLQTLTPYIMPQFGNRPDLAIQKLIDGQASGPSHLLWLTDDLPASRLNNIQAAVSGFSTRSLVAVGTPQGGPIPLPEDQGYLQQDGSLVVVETDQEQIQRTGQDLGFTLVSLDDQPRAQWFEATQSMADQNGRFTQDIGYWLLLPMILIWTLSRRQTLLPGLLLCSLAVAPNPQSPMAASMFKNSEQQAYSAFLNEDYADAASQTDNPMLKGEALFRQGQYEQAAQAFAQSNDADAHFNRGNALAHAGKYQEALAAYQDALNLGPHESARQNLKTLQDYLDKQQQETPQPSDSQQQGERSSNPDEESSTTPDSNAGSNEPSSEDAREQNGESESNQDQTDAERHAPNEQDAGQQQEAEQQSLSENDSEMTPESQASAQERAEALREQQETEAILNRLDSPSGNLLQRKFRYQYQQNPTDPDETLW